MTAITPINLTANGRTISIDADGNVSGAPAGTSYITSETLPLASARTQSITLADNNGVSRTGTQWMSADGATIVMSISGVGTLRMPMPGRTVQS